MREIEIQKIRVATFGILKFLYHFQIGLWRHDNGHPEQQRQQDAAAAVRGQAPGRLAPQYKVGANANTRNHEQQTHAPWIGQNISSSIKLLAASDFNMPAPAHVVHADVIQNQKTEGDDPDPI